MASKQTISLPQSNRVRLVVASSVMLTFISFWLAAAIVLNDLGSSAFYAGGIAEEAVGKSAPWFILGVMLFSFAVRAVYVESCSMFTRGGVYRIVKEALGGTFAKLSVSALMFDYILTGPISGVSAGQYIVGLLNELFRLCAAHHWISMLAMHPNGTARQLHVDGTSAVIAGLITIYFWWQNTKGIEESSDKALKVMKITTVMVVVLLSWGFFSVIHSGSHLPPWPTPNNLHFSKDAFGFLKGTSFMHSLGLFGVLMAFGHSVLAMSGEESLAQVNREIEHPKLKNLKRAAIVIAIYSFIFTGIGTLLAVMLIPDAVRVPLYRDNLIAGMAMFMVGPLAVRIGFRVFVVIVGFLILGGAVNTAIVGSTGVLMRVAEDGVLSDWFRKPQRKYGTSFRIVNLVAGLQMFTIFVTRGNVIMLGEAYAFGVIWSFTFNALAMLVLRWKYKGERGWKVPLNIRFGKTEIPLGLLCVFLVVLTARMMGAGGPEYVDASEQLFSEHEQMLFTKAVSVAESFGKHISLLVVPAGDIFAALVQTANSLDAAAVVSGLSTKLTAAEQAYHVGQAWEALPEPKRQFTFYVVRPDGTSLSFHIGPHAPAIEPHEVQLVHRLWLNLRRAPEMQDLHHSDILSYALTRMASEFARDKEGTLKDLQECVEKSHHRQGLGGLRFEELDEVGPGYAIQSPRSEAKIADNTTTSTQLK